LWASWLHKKHIMLDSSLSLEQQRFHPIYFFRMQRSPIQYRIPLRQSLQLSILLKLVVEQNLKSIILLLLQMLFYLFYIDQLLPHLEDRLDLGKRVKLEEIIMLFSK